MSRRVLLVGWDGADWKVLQPLLDQGLLPNLAGFIESGSRATCLSTVPSHSWCAWPSFMTGLGPAGHGVYDVLETAPGVSRRMPVTSRSIRASTIFESLGDAGKESLVCNVPLTFPPLPIRGKLVSGGVLPRGRPFTHPRELEAELDREAPFPINGMSWTTYRHRPEAFLDDCLETTRRRQRAFEHLLDASSWDLAVMVYVVTDRVQHCLMEYVAPEHPRHGEVKDGDVARKVRSVYRELDEGFGRLLSRADEDDLVILMSDHGHQPCTRACTMDRVLEHLGFLRFSGGSFFTDALRWGPGRRVARRVYDVLGLHGKVALPASPVDWKRSDAYTSVTSTGEGVSVNLAGREAEGRVSPRDYERVRDDLAAALAGFTDPATGTNPIAKVLRKEEVLDGPFLDTAPDLLLIPAPLYSLTHARSMVEDADWISGDHRAEGILVARGPAVEAGCDAGTARLVDLMPTAAAALGVPLRAGLDGRALPALVGEDAAAEAAARENPGAGTGGSRIRQNEEALTPDEETEIADHLRGLGYVE